MKRTRKRAPRKPSPVVTVALAAVPPLARLAVFDPCDDAEPPRFVGKILRTDRPKDVAYAREAIEQYNAWMARYPDEKEPWCMALFSVG